MRKILIIPVLISFLAVLVAPIITLAQEAPKDCCVLKRAIEIEGKSCLAGSVAASNLSAAKACGGTQESITGGAGVVCKNSYPMWGMFCLLNTLYSVTDWIFVALVALAGIFVIMGALNLIMSGGSAEKITTGRNYIIYAMVGLIVGFLARAIPAIVIMIAGM